MAAVELARRHVDDVEFSAEDGARTEPDFLEKISRAVVAAGARTVNIPDTVGYSTPKEYGALIGRIVKALGDCAIVSVHCHDDLGLAVANSLAADRSRSAADRVHHQRHRRARRQLLARRDRHDPQDALGFVPLSHRHSHRASLLRQPAADLHHHVRSATQQGHRGPQRLRARSRHSPGRLPEGKNHLRDHRPAHRGRPRRQARAGQAQRPARPESARQGNGLQLSKRRAGRALPPLHRGGRPSQEGPDGRRNRRTASRSASRRRSAWRRTNS